MNISQNRIMEDKLYMPPEMGEQLKDFRNSYKVKAKDVATNLGKSGAYISKLEKGEIQKIDKKEFIRITNFIAGTEEGYSLFCERATALMDPEALEKHMFFKNFDWCERKLPISNELVKYLNSKIRNHNIIVSELVAFVNANTDLDGNFFENKKIKKEDLEPNKWIAYSEADSNIITRQIIIVELDEKVVDQILAQEVETASYLYLFSLLYHIYKIEELKNTLVLNQDKLDKLKSKTEKKLAYYKIYTMRTKNELINQAKEKVDYRELLSEFDYKNKSLMMKIMGNLSALSDYDVTYMNKKLEGISINFEKVHDPSFVIAYMALPLEKMADKSVRIKKELLSGIANLIERYASMTDDEEFEKY